MSATRSPTAASKTRFFILEGLNSLGAAFYFNYVFFFLEEHFQFSDRNRLLVASLHGLVYMFMSRAAGRIADRIGYLQTFRIGSGVVTLALVWSGCLAGVAWAQLIGIVGWTLGICLTWPPLQAMVAEGESRARTARLIGIYNLVWAGLAGVANFVGGWMYQRFGSQSIFWLPAAFSLGMGVVTTLWLRRPAPTARNAEMDPDVATTSAESHPLNPQFLTLARIANPFAYVAINTVIPLIPHVAQGLRLTQVESGWVNSAWFFGRWIMFLLLWQWAGWHYRRRWMLASYVGLILGFIALLLAPSIWVLVAAQLVFGFSIGLIYYSSLFYSMDAGTEKGTHGGLHEAAIGLGTCVGPAVGAAAMTFSPSGDSSAAWGVTALLLCGLVAVILRSRSMTSPPQRSA